MLSADEVPVMLHVIHLDDNSGYGIYIHGAGTDPTSELIYEFQSKVDQALNGLPST
ncbi:MAG: hypothetical protein NVSMB39_4690 [Candidatus Saccharimonadales bacterium]